MKRIHLLPVAVTTGFLLLGAQSALAVNEFCDSVSGAPGTGVCTVSTSHPPTSSASGAFTIDRNLHITGTGKLITGTAGINITITVGDFLMDAGAIIDGNASGSGSKGGPITVTLLDGDVDMAPGSTIRSNANSGGPIKITTTDTHTIEIDGLVESVGSVSGTGANQAPGGGTITIVAGCALTVSDDGKISSRGQDPGADLVHLQGCTVVINGLVESTGTGHALPNNPANHCNLDPAAHPLGGAQFYDACVEIWGDTVTINSILPHKGEVNANGPRNPGRGWIDVLSRRDITINNDAVGNFSVHANSATATNSNSFGGLVTVKSSIGKVTTSGLAISANGTGAGSNGGDVIVQAGGAGAAGDVAFGTATIQATGPNGSNTAGGHISARSFNGSVTGTAPGSLNAAGGLGQGTPVPGTVDLVACLASPAVTYTGTVTGTRTDTSGVCGGTPSFSAVPHWNTAQSPAQFIAAAANCSTTLCGGTCTKSGVKFNDLNANHVKDGGEPGLGGWTITLWNSTQTAILGTIPTAADGSYSFSGLAPGTYVVCETPQATWNQTFPVAGAGIVACANGSLGYQFTLAFDPAGVCQDLNNDFGNNKPSHKSGMKFNDVDGNGVKDPGDTGISGWPINLYALPANTLVQTVNTNAAGNYSFTIPAAGNYRVCEGQKAGVVSTQTFPHALVVSPPEVIVNTCPANGSANTIWGYEFTVTSGTELTGNDFGNHNTTPGNQECKKQTVIDIMNATYPGNAGPDVTVHTFAGESVQAAVDAAADTNLDGYIIIMVLAHADGSLGGTANQKVVVSKDYGTAKPFGLFGCSVTLTGGGADPAIWIKDTASSKLISVNGRSTTIFVADLHGGNSAVGLQADGTFRYIRNEQPSGNGIGIKVVGNSNTVHNGVAQTSTGVGLQVTGNSNKVTDTQVYSSGSHGVQVTGNSNQLLKIKSGDNGKGNGGDGLNVSGNSNVFEENTSRSNALDGFRIPSGTGNTLKKNISGGSASQNNGDCEYEVVAGNTNLGENKANGATVPGAVPGPFPTGCIGSP